MTRTWWGKLSPPATGYGPISPDAPFVAIGDVHGRADLLEDLIGQLGDDQSIVGLGDYVDRGEDSAGVLRILMDRPGITCLMGNHEEMMLGFLADPIARGPQWLRNGGLQTLTSFGILGMTENASQSQLEEARNRLREEMGEALIGWLSSRPSYWFSGNIAAVHAGADPTTPIQDQPARTLHWGHPAFAREPRTDGIWVLHGHTIVDQPCVHDGRIAIDTGAYATNRLTAAQVSSDGVRFIVA